jgi:hypothetical protein
VVCIVGPQGSLSESPLRFIATSVSLSRKVASREGHKKLKDMESQSFRPLPKGARRLRALLTFETFSWYQTTHALGGAAVKPPLSPITVLRPLGAAFANSLLRGS